MNRWYYLPLMLAVCVLLYLPGLSGPLIFDSKVAITANPELSFDVSVLDQWRVAVVSSSSGPLGRPLSMLTLAANVALSPDFNPTGFKLFNVLLHCLTAVFACGLFYRLLHDSPALRMTASRAQAISLTAVALWLLHPLQVSSVLYVVQRMEQLSVLFVLLGLYFYVRCRHDWLDRAPTLTELSRCALGLSLLLLFAVLSKEDGIILAALVPLVEVVLYRCKFAGRSLPWLAAVCWLAVCGPALGAAAVVIFQPAFIVDAYLSRPWSLDERLLTQSRALWQYIGWFLWPDPRSLGLHHEDIVVSTSLLAPLATLPAMIAWVLVSLALLLGHRRWPLFSFAAGLFLISHSIEASVVALDLVYEHRNYMGGLAVSLLLAWGLWSLPRQLLPARRGLLAIVLLALCGAALMRTTLWGDELALSGQHALDHPRSVRSLYHFANTNLRLGESSLDPELAQQHLMAARVYYQKMLEIDDQDVPALVTLLYLDSRYFSSLASERWKQDLFAAAASRDLYSADHNAFNLLSQCLQNALCDISFAEYEALLLGLAERYQSEPVFYDHLARYYGEVLGDYAAAIQWHELALQRRPGDRRSLYGLIAWHSRSGNQGQALEAIRRLLAADEDQLSIHRVKAMFGEGASG